MGAKDGLAKPRKEHECQARGRRWSRARIQRGTAVLTTAKTLERARENYNISEIPEAAVDEINRIQTRSRLNPVVKTGVPGFIAKGG